MLGSWGNFAWARGQNLYPGRMLSQFSVECYAIITNKYMSHNLSSVFISSFLFAWAGMNPLTEYILGDTKMNLYFLNIIMAQMVQILPHGRQRPFYLTQPHWCKDLGPSVAMVADLILVTEWWIDQDFSKIPILILPQPGRPPLNLMLLCITNTTSLKFKVKFCFATL